MMPEQASGNGTPGTPRLSHFLEAFRRRTLAKAFYFLNCRGQGQIASRPDIWTAQRAQEIDVGGPFTDAFEGHEHFARGIVVEIVEITKIEVAAGQRIGKQARVQSFLAAEADAQQLGVGELQEAGWRERVNGRLEPIEGRFRRGQRYLLLKNDVDERWKAGFSNPQ